MALKKSPSATNVRVAHIFEVDFYDFPSLQLKSCNFLQIKKDGFNRLFKAIYESCVSADIYIKGFYPPALFYAQPKNCFRKLALTSREFLNPLISPEP